MPLAQGQLLTAAQHPQQQTAGQPSVTLQRPTVVLQPDQSMGLCVKEGPGSLQSEASSSGSSVNSNTASSNSSGGSAQSSGNSVSSGGANASNEPSLEAVVAAAGLQAMAEDGTLGPPETAPAAAEASGSPSYSGRPGLEPLADSTAFTALPAQAAELPPGVAVTAYLPAGEVLRTGVPGCPPAAIHMMGSWLTPLTLLPAWHHLCIHILLPVPLLLPPQSRCRLLTAWQPSSAGSAGSRRCR